MFDIYCEIKLPIENLLILSFEWNVVLGAVSDPVVWKFIMTWRWAGLAEHKKRW